MRRKELSIPAAYATHEPSFYEHPQATHSAFPNAYKGQNLIQNQKN